MTEKQIAPWQQALVDSRRKFEEIVSHTGLSMSYDREAMFAMQTIQGNDHLMKIANTNPQSLRNAVINIAAIGLSLNPATAYAYLVPRDNKACLDISYKGMVKLATDTGAVKWVQAELVFEHDTFEYHGPTKAPTHTSNPFATDRGDLVGVYCVAKTSEGDILVEVMPRAEIETIRQTAKTQKVWQSWYGEMAKKSVIKRASKTWPYSGGHERMATAVSVLNEHEGIEETVVDYTAKVDPEKKAKFGELVEAQNGKALWIWQREAQTDFVDTYRVFCSTAPRGQKQALRQRIDAMLKDGARDISEMLDATMDALEHDDDARHLWAEMTPEESEWIMAQLPKHLMHLAYEGRENAEAA